MRVIGDDQGVAVISSSGAVVWLCLSDTDAPSIFERLVYPDGGGALELQPALPFTSTSRYLREATVLETIFTTAGGVVRLIDAMTRPGRELTRRVVGVSGLVPMRWRLRPRPGYAGDGAGLERRGDAVVVDCPNGPLALMTWAAGRPRCRSDRAWGHFSVRRDQRALLALTTPVDEPLATPTMSEVEARLDATIASASTFPRVA